MAQVNRFQEAENLFLQALDIENSEAQAQFVRTACGGDESLRRDVEDLLAVDCRADDLLDRAPALDATQLEGGFDHRLESEISRYKILQEIGEGGFGVVYMAEQVEPVRRKVALKVIKPGMDSRSIISRFEAERQTLAMMDHPNIARVYDGGTTESGYPYFVMELVKGMTITEFCDDQALSTSERISLFIDLCRAIQHAHQKGIIHRDIKPSNILVTLHDGVPVVKVIDFGIAKALHAPLTDKTLFTAFGAMMGTPQYMSPEQTSISGLDVDTRSDIYSMGIVLYELMTGQTPVGKELFRSASVEEIRRLIRDVEPRKPSAFVDTLDEASVTKVAKHRKLPNLAFRRILRGDLDWIVMKAIEKDRNRRYPSASAMADDLQNYLDGNVVSACPPTLSYKLQKLIRKHKGKLAFAACLLAMFVGSSALFTRGYFRERRLNQQLMEARRDFLDNVLGSILVAKGSALEQAIADLQSLREEAVPELQALNKKQSRGSYPWVNTMIALASLNPAEKVGDHLVENIGSLESDLCPSMVSVLRTTEYDPFLLTVYARKAEKNRDLQSKARIAVLGLHLGNQDIAKRMLRIGVDPIQRTEFLHHFPDWHADLNELAQHASTSDDPEFRSGLIQAIGLVDIERDVDAFRKSWQPQLIQWYQNAPDLLTRNSAEWLLRRWEVDLPAPVSTGPRETHDWYVNSAGITMRRIDPGSFTMGDWEGNTRVEGLTTNHKETVRRVQLTRPLYVADKEVTAEQYQDCEREEGMHPCRFLSGQTPFPDWNSIHAFAFCNWLSKREGLTPYYSVDLEDSTSHTYDWKGDLTSNGYRLPTEAEWEYVCRANTITRYSWGQNWNRRSLFVRESQDGIALPNPWGLFDMHGSLAEVCQDRYREYSVSLDLLSHFVDPVFDNKSEPDCVIRGTLAEDQTFRSSVRDHASMADGMWSQIGLRVVRNVVPPAPSPEPPRNDSKASTIEHVITLNEPHLCAPHYAELGMLALEAGQHETATECFFQLLSIMEPYEDWSSQRTQFLVRLAEHKETFRELKKRLPDNTHLQLCEARNHAFHQRWKEAAKIVLPIFKQRDQLDSRWRSPAADQEWHELAIYLLLGGQTDAFAEERRWMLEQIKNSSNHWDSRNWIVLKAVTLPGSLDHDEQALLKNLIEMEQDLSGNVSGQVPFGFSLFRQGEYAKMLELWTQRRMLNRSKTDARIVPHVAMAEFLLGNKESSRSRLTKLLNDENHVWRPDLQKGWPAQYAWTHGLSANLYVEEAKQLILAETGSD